MVDLSISAHKGGALTTATNPAYEMTKQGGQGSHEYELVGVSPGTVPPIAKAADKTYEMPSPPSLPDIPLSVAPPTGGDVGVAKEGGRGKRVCMTTISDHVTYHSDVCPGYPAGC